VTTFVEHIWTYLVHSILSLYFDRILFCKLF